MKLSSALLAAALLVVSAPAASNIRYHFTANSSFEGISGSFSFVTSSFITHNIFLPVSGMEFCSVATPIGQSCSPIFPSTIEPITLNDDGDDFRDVIGFQVGFFRPNYSFANGAFSTLGTHQTIDFGASQSGTLVISQVAAVPEPSSWALMIAGFGLVGAVMRRQVGRVINRKAKAAR